MRSMKSILGLMSVIATVTSASSFTKQLGGTGTEELLTISTSSTGDLCVSGTYTGATTDIGRTTLTSADSSSQDVFVAKMGQDGTMDWVKGWGTSGYNNVASAFDSSGNIGVVGAFKDATMSLAGMSVTGSSTVSHAYVAKLDSSGTALWTSSFGDTTIGNSAGAMAVAFDSSGNLYANAHFKGTITLGGTSYTPTGGSDGLVIKYSSSGTVDRVFTWGGTDDEGATGIQVDSAGNVYVLAIIGSPTSTANTFTLGADTISGAASAQYSVLFKLDSSFNVLWTTQIGGADASTQHPAKTLSVDSASNVYVVGIQYATTTTIGTTIVTGAGTSIPAGYVASFTSAGAFRWANNLAGSSATQFHACALSDDDYYLRVAGLFGSASLTVGSNTMSLKGIRDCMIATVDAATGQWVGATSTGNSGTFCSADYVAYPSTDTLVVGGWFMNTLTTFRGSSVSTAGDNDVWVEQFDTSTLGIASKSKKTSSGSSGKAGTLSDGGIAGVVIAIAVLLIIGILGVRRQQQQKPKQNASELPVVVGQGTKGNVAVQNGASLS